MHDLDHLLWEEYSLAEGEKRFFDLSGVKPDFGGSHPELGTHNSVLSLGQDSYLELIAHDPEHPKMAHLPRETPFDFKPGLFAFVLKSRDLNVTETLVERSGLKVVKRLEVKRQSPDGETLMWQTFLVGSHDFGHFTPAFTYPKKGKHPSETAPQGCRLLEFSVGHPKSEQLTRLYRALRIDVPVLRADKAHLLAVLSTPRGNIHLRSQ